MGLKDLFLAVFIASGFVAWPIIGKFSNVGGGMVGTLVLSTSAIVIAMLSAKQFSLGLLSVRTLAMLCIAGVINGIAVFLYAGKTSDPAIQTGIFIVIISVLMVVIGPLLDWIINGSTLSSKQAIGLVFAIVAIYLVGAGR